MPFCRFRRLARRHRLRASPAPLSSALPDSRLKLKPFINDNDNDKGNDSNKHTIMSNC